ncbi:MAG: DUF4956 domain-containing protein [Atopobiaceae bacterium]|nr:DUF4956 domain-containing protein [Atopobiaceae bacterium]
MFESIFASVDTTTTASLSLVPFLTSVAAALGLGLLLSLIYCFRSRFTKSFVITLATLPAIVAVVIMMVNGNLGAGVAVAGTFSLVRFRSVPGQARDIAFIFLSMAVGLVCGMGYLGYALLICCILGGANLLLQLADFGGNRARLDRTIRITVPEDLDFVGLFDDVLDVYTSSHDLVGVKTANMGSLYKLTYDVQLKDAGCVRELVDNLRCRNGNLEIALSYQAGSTDEL